MKTVHRFARFGTIAAAAMVAAILSCTSEPLSPAPNLPPASLELKIADLNVVSVGDTAILLTWTPPSGSFDFYKIYRTSSTDTTGRPDSTTLLSTELRSNVSRSATSFLDIPELNEGVYYYAIRAAKIDGLDTVVGGLNWATAPCTVGALIRLAVNSGDIFTSDTAVELDFSDPRGKVQSVRFTQLVRNYTRNPDGTLTPAIVDTGVGSIPGDSANQIRDLKRTGWWISAADTAQKNRVSIPQFDTFDVHNPDASLTGITGTARKAWNLLPHLGQKTVYAEILFKSGAIAKDTIFDQISTMPHNLEIGFRNAIYPMPNSSMNDTTETINTHLYTIAVFYRDSIDFSIKINSDSTLYTPFDCWLMFSDNEYASNSPGKTFTDGTTTEHWRMTAPVPFALTGSGYQHDPDHVYHFSLDPNSDAGQAVINGVRSGKNAFFDDSLQTLASKWLAINQLSSGALYSRGKKQFIMVTRFTEKFFQDVVLQIYGYNGATEVARTWMDSYAPVVCIQPKQKVNPYHLGQDSIITRPFTFALDTQSVISNGYAIINEINLIIAKVPAGMNHDPATAATLTVDQVRRIRNMEIPFPITTSSYVQKFVQWNNIDPTTWPSGYYIMGVITGDIYGHEDFSNLYLTISGSSIGINPWFVNIQTAY